MNTINEMEIGWSELDIINPIAQYHNKYLAKLEKD